jgi:hypothetical protein
MQFIALIPLSLQTLTPIQGKKNIGQGSFRAPIIPWTIPEKKRKKIFNQKKLSS